MNAFKAQLLRELWEHPMLYVAPIVIGALLLVACVVGLSMASSFGTMISISIEGLDPADLAYAEAGIALALLAFLPAFFLPVVAIISFYLLECLGNERRDRSILFFKSLPVSDLMTVLAKLATALLVVPALAVAALAVTHVGALILGTIGLSFAGGGVVSLWSPGRLLSVWTLAAYSAFAAALWYSPVYCFFLAVSAWARRATLVWASSPLLLILIEQSLRGRSLMQELIGAHMAGFWATAYAHRVQVSLADSNTAETMHDLDPATFSNVWAWMDPVALMASPALWGGLVVAVGFTGIAVMLRRYRDDT